MDNDSNRHSGGTWTPKMCRLTAFWARCVGPGIYMLLEPDMSLSYVGPATVNGSYVQLRSQGGAHENVAPRCTGTDDDGCFFSLSSYVLLLGTALSTTSTSLRPRCLRFFATPLPDHRNPALGLQIADKMVPFTYFRPQSRYH